MTHIAFIGSYGVGKTTAANFLVTQRGHMRLPFADEVKQDCADMLDYILDRDYENGGTPNPASITKDTIERYKKTTFGPLLQWYGTDFWRGFMCEPNHWIDVWVRRFDELTESCQVVVDDCRFLNEADALRGLGFHLVRLIRHTSDAPQDARTTSHASETEQYSIPVHGAIDLTGTTLSAAQDAILSYYDGLTTTRSRYVSSTQTQAVEIL